MYCSIGEIGIYCRAIENVLKNHTSQYQQPFNIHAIGTTGQFTNAG